MNSRASNPPPWMVSEWFNAKEDVTLERLRGQAVVACAFQMLCPGCVAQAIPQMKSVHELFAPMGVSVIGLHTVFEHHDAMTPIALEAFLHEYRIAFPVGVDAPGERGDSIPQTMKLYQMQGTPTVLLYDRNGRLRRQAFGHMPDLRLGAEIMTLINESATGEDMEADGAHGPGCTLPS